MKNTHVQDLKECENYKVVMTDISVNPGIAITFTIKDQFTIRHY